MASTNTDGKDDGASELVEKISNPQGKASDAKDDAAPE